MEQDRARACEITPRAGIELRHSLPVLVEHTKFESLSFQALFVMLLNQNITCLSSVPRTHSSQDLFSFLCPSRRASFTPGPIHPWSNAALQRVGTPWLLLVLPYPHGPKKALGDTRFLVSTRQVDAIRTRTFEPFFLVCRYVTLQSLTPSHSLPSDNFEQSRRNKKAPDRGLTGYGESAVSLEHARV